MHRFKRDAATPGEIPGEIAKQSACIALYYRDMERSGTYSLYLG